MKKMMSKLLTGVAAASRLVRVGAKLEQQPHAFELVVPAQRRPARPVQRGCAVAAGTVGVGGLAMGGGKCVHKMGGN